MKERSGFVSNSSSASFIVEWQGPAEHSSLEEADYLGTHEFVMQKLPGLFRASFWTCMYNCGDIDDEFPGARQLIAALVANDRAYVTSIEED